MSNATSLLLIALLALPIVLVADGAEALPIPTCPSSGDCYGVNLPNCAGRALLEKPGDDIPGIEPPSCHWKAY